MNKGLDSSNKFIDYAESFLLKHSSDVKPKTLKRYKNDLYLFNLYLERCGTTDINRLTWRHIEEFFSWWYLRQHMECSVSGARGLFATINKFCKWLHGLGLLNYDKVWDKNQCKFLKDNIERVLKWEREVSNYRAHNSRAWLHEDNSESEVIEGWFKVIHKIGEIASIRCIDDNSAYIVRFEGVISKYILTGDIISGILCQEEDGLYVNDDFIWFLYPPMAGAYIR